MGDSSSPQQAGRLVPGQEQSPSFGSSSIYDSAEFHLYCRKIVACSKRYSHEWTTCPFAHPGEKAKRRDPRTHQYDCEMCPTIAKGEVCELGAACAHSHHVFESWLHPQKFRTMICKDGEACHREVCFFAHGAEQLRAPSGGPSKLRKQSCSQDEAARQAGPAPPAAVVGNGSYCGAQNPQAAAADAAAAAAQLNGLAGNVGGSSSSSRHVWFQGLQQQQQQQGAVPVMPYVEAGAFAGTSTGKGKGVGSGSGMSAATSHCLYVAALSSSSTGLQANCDSRRSSLCESSTSNVMVGPAASGMQMSGNSAYSGSLRNSLELSRPPIAGGLPAAAAGCSTENNAGVTDMSSMQMLVSSLMTEIQNSRQEAIDSRHAAVQAQQQLKAITEALNAGGSGVPADAAAQAGQLLGGNPAAAAARDQLQQQQQRAMMQRAGSGMPAFCDAGSGSGLQLAGPGLVRDGSNMSCSGNWAAAAAGMMAGLSSSSFTASDTAVANLEQAVAHRLSLEQAVAAAGGASSGSSNYGMLVGTADGQQQGYGVPSSYPIAAGNAGYMNGMEGDAVCGAGVMNWLQLLPPAQGLDAAATYGDFSTASAGIGNDMSASGVVGVATGSSWRNNSFDAAAPVFGLTPAATAAAASQGLMSGSGQPPVTVALPVGSNGMQQQQQSHQQQHQLTSDYLLCLQQQHSMLSAPELAFAGAGGAPHHSTQQQLQAMRQHQAMQQQQVIRSAPVMLQGWQGAGRVACVEDCINSSGTVEGMNSHSADVPAGYTASGGNRQLGWL